MEVLWVQEPRVLDVHLEIVLANGAFYKDVQLWLVVVVVVATVAKRTVVYMPEGGKVLVERADLVYQHPCHRKWVALLAVSVGFVRIANNCFSKG
jgi:hypothetical protein